MLQDLLAPDKPDTRTFEELSDAQTAHFEPKPLVIAERFYFYNWNQKPTESVEEYVAELRRFATHCEFVDVLNDALRDRLVCGLRNHGIQQRLLTEAGLTLAKAVEVAQGQEAAAQNLKKLRSASEGIEVELDRLESAGVVEKVTHSKWAAPVVPAPKGMGSLGCAVTIYKVTVNPALEVDRYPLPKPEDLFATLAGGKCFTKIDLTHAYQQMALDKQSRELVTINTHKGLYCYTRLPFGVASAPAIFQKTTDTVLQGLPKVICYLDYILVTGI